MLPAHHYLWNDATTTLFGGLQLAVYADWLVVVDDPFLMGRGLSFSLQPVEC